MESYMNAIYQHDLKAVPPLAIDYRMTENTGRVEVGEGVMWRSKVEPTPFVTIPYGLGDGWTPGSGR